MDGEDLWRGGVVVVVVVVFVDFVCWKGSVALAAVVRRGLDVDGSVPLLAILECLGGFAYDTR
jgi:hypothetical protein